MKEFLFFLLIFNSLNAILEIYKKIIINPLMYKIKIINEIHEVLLIKLVINVIKIVCSKIIIFDLRGDFVMIKVSDIIKLVIKIILIIIFILF